MRQERIARFVILTAGSTALGFFGSFILFLGWLVAPGIGWGWRHRTPFASWSDASAVTLGIFIGGLPVWVGTTIIFDVQWPILLPIMAAMNALLFLAGAVASEITDLFLRLKGKSGGGGNPPSSSNRPGALNGQNTTNKPRILPGGFDPYAFLRWSMTS